MVGHDVGPGIVSPAARLATTLALAIAGSLVFWGAGFPVPWISGAMVVVAAAALAGVPLHLPLWLRELTFFVLGLSIGAALTPQTVTQIGRWPASLLLMLLTLPVVSLGAALVLIRWRGWQRDDAMLASVPGALSLILALADATDADVPRIALVQALRVAILVIVVPPLIVLASEVPPPAQTAPSAPGALPDLPDVAILAGAGLLGVVAIRLIRLPAPWLLGALAASAALHVAGLVQAPVPDEALLPAFVVLGAAVGVRFAGLGWAALRSGIVDGLLVVAAGFALSAAAALLAARLLGFSFGLTILAFAPGAFEVMTVMAFALGLDAAYVGAHHTVRFAALALLSPLLFGRRHTPLRRRGGGDGGASRER
jgi:membrane AbrB-like protein